MAAEQIENAEKSLEEVKTMRSKNFLPLNIQLFASDGAGDGGGAGDGSGQQGDESNNNLSTEALDKLIQSRVDKITAELGKKNSTLQKELDKLKKDKLTDEEIKNLEIADKEKAITEKEQALLERENRLFAIKAIKEAELDDGSDKSLELIDFVLGKDEDEITTRVKSFKTLVDKFVTAKVDQTFKANGRVPNGGGAGNGAGGSDKPNIAAELGKKAAEANKKSSEILNYYYGGNK